MPRPIWSGTISFGLVSIPVKLYNAVSKKSASFNQLDSRTMSRIKLKKTSADDGSDVPDDVIVKGYEISKTQYVVVDPDELEQFMPVPTRSIDLDEFVELSEIDPIFFDSPYYLAPDKSVKPYVLLARAMAESGKVAIGRFVLRNKQYTAAIRAVDGHLVMSTMVYGDEIVQPKAIDGFDGLEAVELSDRETAMATQLVESLAGTFEPQRYRDAYREQVLDLIEKKAAGETLVAAAPASTTATVVDLMAAPEASVQAAKKARGRHPTARDPEAVAAPAKRAPQTQERLGLRRRLDRSASLTGALAPRTDADQNQRYVEPWPG
jgi:DNA end-binding protein Ku